MKYAIVKPRISFVAGLLLSLPTAFFILASLLKYTFGAPALFDAIAPVLEQGGIRQTIGWNINLLVLFGPLVALLLNLSNTLEIDCFFPAGEMELRVHIRKRWMNLSIAAFSALILLTLFIYMVGENCR